MLGHSVSYYLPKYWATTPLYAEKIIPLLDNMLSVGSKHADKLALAYFDIINKYQNPEEMTDEAIKAYVKEQGYGYILDLLSTSSDNLQRLLFVLPLIAYLKDSKKGLEVVLSLLQTSDKPVNTKITEWYEHTPVRQEDTFTIESDINLATVNSDFFEKFDRFIQKYVYPTLTGLTVSYSVTGSYTILPVVQTRVVVDLVSGDMDLNFTTAKD